MKTIDSYGKPIKSDDLDRIIWYSIKCTYWTDDWNKVAKVGPGIPCCPVCRSVGCQIPIVLWEEGIKKQKPGYSDLVAKAKENCMPIKGYYG
jgi:hypothetical protein